MGVRGLRSFVTSNTRDFCSSVLLKDCKVIIDGFSLVHEIYYCSTAETAYGGDYVEFSAALKNFLTWLEKSKIIAYFVFDGATDLAGTKLGTLLCRFRERIHLVGLARHRKRVKLLPILAFKTCVDVLIEMDVPYCVCDYEADKDLAALAQSWKCPVMTNDSDLLLFNLHSGVILLDHMNISSLIENEPQEEFYVSLYTIAKVCWRYRIKDYKVLQYLSVICGNDHIPSNLLSDLREQLNKKSGSFDVERYVKWLGRTGNSVKTKAAILSAVMSKGRVEKAINEMAAFYSIDTASSNGYLEKYFTENTICHANDNVLYTELPELFWSQFRSAAISKDVVQILMYKKRILSPQMELLIYDSAWHCSDFIRHMIYNILDGSLKSPLHRITEFNREQKHYSETAIDVPVQDAESKKMKSVDLPYIYSCDMNAREIFLLELLTNNKIEEKSLDNIPKITDDQRFNNVISGVVLHWLNNTSPVVHKVHLLSLLLCVISLNDSTIDQKEMQKEEDPGAVTKFFHSPDQDQKHKDGLNLNIVHAYSQFQCVLSDCLDLVGLIALEVNICIHQVYSGRFVYNLCLELSKQPQPLQYCETLLEGKCQAFDKLSRWYHFILDTCTVALQLENAPLPSNTPFKKTLKMSRLQKLQTTLDSSEDSIVRTDESLSESLSRDDLDVTEYSADSIDNRFALLSIES